MRRDLEPAADSEFVEDDGWGERIRTFDYLIQSQAPYQLGHAPAGRLRLPQCIKGFPQRFLSPNLGDLDRFR